MYFINADFNLFTTPFSKWLLLKQANLTFQIIRVFVVNIETNTENLFCWKKFRDLGIGECFRYSLTIWKYPFGMVVENVGISKPRNFVFDKIMFSVEL